MKPAATVPPAARGIFALIGIALLAYALYAHLLLPGIVLLVVIVLGVLLLVAGIRGRIR